MVLAAAFAAIYARLLRSNLVEVLGEDYIRTARAKGLPERKVVLKHGVRSAITPLVTVLGLDIGIDGRRDPHRDGLQHRWHRPALLRRDPPRRSRDDQGTTLVLAVAVAIMSLVVDILYAFLDPRVKY